jgi:hypothetical protein
MTDDLGNTALNLLLFAMEDEKRAIVLLEEATKNLATAYRLGDSAEAMKNWESVSDQWAEKAGAIKVLRERLIEAGLLAE